MKITSNRPFGLKHLKNIFLILLFLAMILYLFLIMPNFSRQDALTPFQNYDFAHRGLFDNQHAIPENSLVAFQKAIDEGYGIELDVQLTKDQIPVVVHDYNLERLCGKDILVSSLTFEELSNYTLFNSNETIPTLQEVLTLIDGQVPIMIELKVEFDYKATCKQVASLLHTYDGDYCIVSFSPLALGWFRKNEPTMLRGQLSTDLEKENVNQQPIIRFAMTHLLLNCLSRPDFIAYQHHYIDHLSFKICKNIFRVPTAVWTITDLDTYERLKSTTDFIIFEGFTPSYVVSSGL